MSYTEAIDILEKRHLKSSFEIQPKVKYPLRTIQCYVSPILPRLTLGVLRLHFKLQYFHV